MDQIADISETLLPILTDDEFNRITDRMEKYQTASHAFPYSRSERYMKFAENYFESNYQKQAVYISAVRRLFTLQSKSLNEN